MANVKVAIVGTSTLIANSDRHKWTLRINCDVLHLVFALLFDLQYERLVAEALRLIISEVVEIYAALLDYLNKLNNSRVVVVRAGFDEGWFDIFDLFRHDGVHARVHRGLERGRLVAQILNIDRFEGLYIMNSY